MPSKSRRPTPSARGDVGMSKNPSRQQSSTAGSSPTKGLFSTGNWQGLITAKWSVFERKLGLTQLFRGQTSGDEFLSSGIYGQPLRASSVPLSVAAVVELLCSPPRICAMLHPAKVHGQSVLLLGPAWSSGPLKTSNAQVSASNAWKTLRKFLTSTTAYLAHEVPKRSLKHPRSKSGRVQ